MAGAPPRYTTCLGASPALLNNNAEERWLTIVPATRGSNTTGTRLVETFLGLSRLTARSPAEQIAAYFAEGKRALGVVPSEETLVLERFFDDFRQI